MQNLVFVKGKLQDWNKSTFGNLRVTKEKLCTELNDIDKMVERMLEGRLSWVLEEGTFYIPLRETSKRKKFFGTKRQKGSDSRKRMETPTSSIKLPMEGSVKIGSLALWLKGRKF